MKSKGIFFARRSLRSLKSFEKFLIKRRENPALPKKDRTSGIVLGGDNLEISSTLVYQPLYLYQKLCVLRQFRLSPWNGIFFQLRTRFSLHLINTNDRWYKPSSKVNPKTEKSSMKASRNRSTISEKMLNIIHCWKVARALHSPKGMRR